MALVFTVGGERGIRMKTPSPTGWSFSLPLLLMPRKQVSSFSYWHVQEWSEKEKRNDGACRLSWSNIKNGNRLSFTVIISSTAVTFFTSLLVNISHISNGWVSLGLQLLGNMFVLGKYCQTVFQSDYTKLRSLQQYLWLYQFVYPLCS